MLSFSEVAVEYGVSRTTIDRLVEAGKLEKVPGSKPAKVTLESCERYFQKPDPLAEVLRLQKRVDILHTFIVESVQGKIKAQGELIQKQQSVIEDLVYRLTKLEMVETPTIPAVQEEDYMKHIDEGWD